MARNHKSDSSFIHMIMSIIGRTLNRSRNDAVSFEINEHVSRLLRMLSDRPHAGADFDIVMKGSWHVLESASVSSIREITERTHKGDHRT
jgi:hypothetical protein